MTDDGIRTLARFNLPGADGGYTLKIGGNGGGLIRTAACLAQIEAIIDGARRPAP